MRINKKLLLITPIIIVIAIPAIVIAKFGLDCSNQRSVDKSSKQQSIDEFNKISILPDQPTKKGSILNYGDCIDSKPGVGAEKTYNMTMNGGSAVDSIRTGLKNSGYIITKEDFGREGCKILYRLTAKKDAVEVYVVANQKKLKDPRCTDGYPTGITEKEFRSQNIDHVAANLRV